MKFFDFFDKVIFLTLSNNYERHKNINNIINKFKIKNSYIYYSTKRPSIDLKCSTLFPQLKTDYYNAIELTNKYIYANNFNVSLNHFTIIKIAYELGYNNILICEDDVSFIDSNLLDLLINKIDFDYDIIKFSDDTMIQETLTLDYLNNEEILFNLFNKKSLPEHFCNLSSQCYALSRNGMKIYIDYVLSNEILCEDLIFKELIKNTDIKLYGSKYKLITNEFESTII